MTNLLILSSLILLVLKESGTLSISYFLVFSPLMVGLLMIAFSSLLLVNLLRKQKKTESFLKTHSQRMEIAMKLDSLTKDGKSESPEYLELQTQLEKLKRQQ